jgi:hypothetical protein
MGSDHEAEIRASAGAHRELGPDYDDAVAEGLVERIGAEIDKRIDARLGRYGPPASGAPGYPGHQGYPGYPGYPPSGYQVPPEYRVPAPSAKPVPWYVRQRSVAATITALGSMALGVAATAVVSRAGSPGAQAVMVLLIWTAIAVINIAYARRS